MNIARHCTILSVLFLCACAALHQTKAPAPHVSNPFEITDHPAILYDGSVPRWEMTLRGVKLNDPRSAIAMSRIDYEAQGHWIVCRDGCRYRLDDKDNVSILGVWDRQVIDTLKLGSPDEIQQRFGKPQSTDDAGQVQIYRYSGGHISVLWNGLEKQTNAINISR